MKVVSGVKLIEDERRGTEGENKSLWTTYINP